MEHLPTFPKAWGLRYVRPGFCFTPEQDALFALGWPHLRVLADNHRDDADPVSAARRFLMEYDAAPRLVWSKPVARGVVRVLGQPSIFELAPGEQSLRQEAEEALWNPEKLGEGELRDLLDVRLNADVPGVSDRTIATFVLLAEALTSTEIVVRLATELLEAMEPEVLLAEWTLPMTVTWQLGYLLLRLPEDKAPLYRARLEKVLAKAVASRPELGLRGFRGKGPSHARALHIVLNGGPAAEEATDHAPRWYTHVVDEAVLVRMRVAVNRLSYQPDARLIFLGGMDVAQRFAKDWTRLKNTDEQRWFFQQIAPINAPEIRSLLLEMTATSLVRAEAVEWFKTNLARVGGWLKETQGENGRASSLAADVLKQIEGR